MRNLKRALSLTLASVMLLGMMVVGSSAAAGYDDVKETDNVEAIEVLQEIEVMVGDERGFGPDRPVNRAEMAVVMGKLLNLDYNYYESACPFTDVSGNYAWAKGWVGAAYANKILSGRSATVFDPGATVTAVEAASMMMRALGYFQYAEDVADGFQLATVRQGSEIGIFNGVGTDGNTAMTRNQVAQMALNALQADMVRFTGTPGIDVNGVKVGYKAEYTPRTSTDPKYNRLIDNKHSSNIDYSGQYYVQLGEELYNGDLTKRYVTDDFERPSFNWQFKGKEIGTYVNYTIREAEYTEAVKYSDLYDLLTYTTIDENDLDRFVDGVDQSQNKSDFRRSNKNEVGGQGVLTEVFVDRDRNQITITSINTYLAQANSDYNATNETLSLKVYETSATGVTKIVDVKDVPKIEGVKKDEYKLVYLSGKDNNSATNKVVSKIYDTEILAESSITKWSNADAPKVVDKLTTGGTEYKSNPMAFYDDGNVLDKYDMQLLTDNTYNIYLDRYGNVIGVDLFEGAKNYVFITGYDRGRSNISVKTADAAAIFLDGTMDVITVNVTDTDKNIDALNGTMNDGIGDNYFQLWSSASNLLTGGKRNENRWYTYTVNNSGVYTLTPATRMFATDYNYAGLTDGTKILDCANLYVDDNGTINWNGGAQINPGTPNKGRAYGEDASIYITVKTDRVDTSVNPTDAITEVNNVYTGIQDVKLELRSDTQNTVPNAVYTVYDKDNYIIASIVLGEAQGATGSYGYILGSAKSEEIRREGSTRAEGDVTYYWEFDAVYEGEKTTLQAKTKYPSSLLLHPYTVQELRFDGEYVTDLKDVPLNKLHTSNTVNTKIEDMYVYDVGQAVGTSWTDDNTGNLDNTNAMPNGNGGTIGGRINSTLDLQGRTLKTTVGTEVGLALAKEAKAVTVQMEDGKREVTNHASVSDAIARLADRAPNTDGVQFKGRIVAVLDGRGVAQWVVFISDTELKTGNNPNYGTDTTGQDYQSWVKGNLVHVALVDTPASLAAIRTEAARALLAAGYTNPQTVLLSNSGAIGNLGTAGKGNLTGLITCDGNYWFDVEYQNFWTLKVNGGQIVEYVEHNTPTDTTEAQIKTAGKDVGTGYIIGGASKKYKPYSASTTNKAWGSNVTEPMTADTGYVVVPTSANISAASVSNSLGTAPTATLSNTTGYAKVGSSITVTVATTANAGATKAAKVNVALGDATAATVTAEKTVTVDQAKNAQTLTFTISNIQKATGTITVNANDYTPPADISVKLLKTGTTLTANNVTVSGVTINGASFDGSADVTATIKSGEDIVITMTVNGAADDSGVKVAFGDGSATYVSKSISKTNDTNGAMTISGADVNLAESAEIKNATITLTLKGVTVVGSGITITVGK